MKTSKLLTAACAFRCADDARQLRGNKEAPGMGSGKVVWSALDTV